jgi:hypothetical protein
MPCNKTSFRTELDALQTLEKLRSIPSENQRPCRTYLCFCGLWHLTSVWGLEHEQQKQIKNLELRVSRLEKENQGLQELLAKEHRVSKNLRIQLHEIITNNMQKQFRDDNNE